MTLPPSPPDPVGHSPPRVASVDIVRAIHQVGASFGLLCRAQGFPLPTYRYDAMHCLSVDE